MEISVNKRVEKLRAYMREHQLDAFIIPSTDPHAGEYVPEHWESRTWISGFDGSAGTAVVTLTQAALWTDSRYFLAAEQQLKDTCFILMRDKLVETPTIPEWLGEILPEGAIVGIDGSVNTTASVAETKAQLERHHLRLNTEHDPFEEVWEGRPAIPENPVHIHPLKYAGEPTHEKLARIRKRLAEEPCAGIIVNRLDDIAWLTNMRGTDVYQSPMFVSYMLITPADATLPESRGHQRKELRRYRNRPTALHSPGIMGRSAHQLYPYSRHPRYVQGDSARLTGLCHEVYQNTSRDRWIPQLYDTRRCCTGSFPKVALRSRTQGR
jgi:Xaa-Pro aminopeptidase